MSSKKTEPSEFGPVDVYEFLEKFPERSGPKGNFKCAQWLIAAGIVSVYQDDSFCQAAIDGAKERLLDYRWIPGSEWRMEVYETQPDRKTAIARAGDQTDWQAIGDLLLTYEDSLERLE